MTEYLQNITEETQVVVSEIVAEITSEPENLTAADISASASILTDLTEGAIKNPEVWLTEKASRLTLHVRNSFKIFLVERQLPTDHQ